MRARHDCSLLRVALETDVGQTLKTFETRSEVDPVVCGAQIVSALQSVVARNVAPSDTAVLSVTGFGAGVDRKAHPNGNVRSAPPW